MIDGVVHCQFVFGNIIEISLNIIVVEYIAGLLRICSPSL